MEHSNRFLVHVFSKYLWNVLINFENYSLSYQSHAMYVLGYSIKSSLIVMIRVKIIYLNYKHIFTHIFQ